MRIIATADLHGNLPYNVPECDLLLIAGDVCPLADHSHHHQRRWLQRKFATWLERQPARHIVGIAGNHDFVMESDPALALGLPWTYLLGSSVTIEGLRVHGLPWVPNLRRWAFHASDEALATRYDMIPANTDLILSHGPPRGYGDFVNGSLESAGAVAANWALERTSAGAFVCGHIHEGYGAYRHPSGAWVYNVAHCTEFYDPINPPVEVVL